MSGNGAGTASKKIQIITGFTKAVHLQAAKNSAKLNSPAIITAPAISLVIRITASALGLRGICDKFRVIFEVHVVEDNPVTAPDKSFFFEDFSDFGGGYPAFF